MKITFKAAVLLSILAFAAPRAIAAPGEKYPQTRTRVLSAKEVARLSAAQRRYAINEIYARHGLLFGDLALRKQFLQFGWYAPQPGRTMAQIKRRFSSVERKNVERLGLAREIANVSVKSDGFGPSSETIYVSPYAGTKRALRGERFPETRIAVLDDKAMAEMSDAQMRYALNEIYARRGYLFQDMALRKQFLQFAWYKPRPGRNMAQIRTLMTRTERENIAFLASAD